MRYAAQIQAWRAIQAHQPHYPYPAGTPIVQLGDGFAADQVGKPPGFHIEKMPVRPVDIAR
jgi:hypothetical protein